MSNANDLEKDFDAANSHGADANHQNNNQDTHLDDNKDKNDPKDGEPVDYKKKFSASTAENQRLMREQEAKDAEIARLKALVPPENDGQGNGNGEPANTTTDDSLYPGFEELDPEAQTNLLNYTKMVESRVRGEIMKDPAIAHSRQVYAEKKWNDAFQATLTQFPDLAADAEGFKQKYFKPANVPNNIGELMQGLAKIYLFDKQKEKGAAEERERADRIDTERTHGGDKQPTGNRTMDDWEHLAATDPVKFASLAKEYNADLTSGKLK